jgi:hypothetical protein
VQKTDAYCPPGVPLSNVAETRSHGVTSLAVHCENYAVYCYHQSVKTFDELQLPTT